MRESSCDCCGAKISIGYMNQWEPARITTNLVSCSGSELIKPFRGYRSPLPGLFDDGNGGRFVDVKLTMELCTDCKKKVDHAIVGELNSIREDNKLKRT
jgi:hypothetical protein